MTISVRIHKAAVNFETLTGQKPGVVFMGHKEWEEFSAMAKSYAIDIPVQDGSLTSFVSYLGMRMIEVKSESFLAAAPLPLHDSD